MGRHPGRSCIRPRRTARGDLGGGCTGGLRQARPRGLYAARGCAASGRDLLPAAVLPSPQRPARMCAGCPGRGRLSAAGPRAVRGARRALVWRRRGHYRRRLARTRGGRRGLSAADLWRDLAGKLAPRPLLVVLGKADTRLPYSCGVQIYEWAQEPKRLVLYEGAEHRLDECADALDELFNAVDSRHPASRRMNGQRVWSTARTSCTAGLVYDGCRSRWSWWRRKCMSIAPEEFVSYMTAAFDGMLTIAEELGDARLNERPHNMANTSTPCAIVTHCIGLTRYWLGTVIAGRQIARDRDAEFRARRHVADLRQAVRQVQQEIGPTSPTSGVIRLRRSPTRCGRNTRMDTRAFPHAVLQRTRPAPRAHGAEPGHYARTWTSQLILPMQAGRSIRRALTSAQRTPLHDTENRRRSLLPCLVVRSP